MGAGLPAMGAYLCLGAGCAKGGSPWTSRAPTSTSDVVDNRTLLRNGQKIICTLYNVCPEELIVNAVWFSSQLH